LGELKNAARADALYEKACDLGDAYGCRDLGLMLNGTFGGAARDPARVEALRKREAETRERLCDKGDFRECWLALSPRAQYQACEHGDPQGCYRLGRSYLDGNMSDTPRAAHFYEKGCELGDGAQCVELAAMYAEGRGLPADLARATALYEKGCGLGTGGACATLGDFAASGRGRARDLVAAASYYGKACDAASDVGCFARGEALREGRGVARDPAGAALAYRRACDRNYKEACHQLALLLWNGTGVAQDRPLAINLMRDACSYESAMDGGQPASCRDACKFGDARSCAAIGKRVRQP
jgi:TPR repeat protein